MSLSSAPRTIQANRRGSRTPTLGGIRAASDRVKQKPDRKGGLELPLKRLETEPQPSLTVGLLLGRQNGTHAIQIGARSALQWNARNSNCARSAQRQVAQSVSSGNAGLLVMRAPETGDRCL